MERYADYEFYTTEYGGSMPEAAFRGAMLRASAYLDQITFDRIAGTTWATDERVKIAACAAADQIYRSSERGGKTSESNDGYSVTWDTAIQTADSIYQEAAIYLADTDLLYQGVIE